MPATEHLHEIAINKTPGFIRIWPAHNSISGGVIPGVFVFRIFTAQPTKVYRLRGCKTDDCLTHAETEEDAISYIKAAIEAGGLHPSPTQF